MAGNLKVPDDKLTRKIAKLAVMEANSASREDKIRELFGVDIKTATDREINNCDSAMSRWRKHPMFDQAWKEEQRRWCYEDFTLAMSVFRKGMKQDKDGWLAMNSAVNALSNANKRLFHDEDSAVTVKIEGLPDIGSPDDDG
jgi:hypothetical protein